MQETQQIPTTRPVERVLAILGAVACLIVSVLIWMNASQYQSMWPFPALYLIEIVVLSLLAAFMFIRGDPRGKFITWGATGAIFGLTIMGAMSVGSFYLPVALIFAVISITSDLRARQPIAAHLGVCLMAGVAQAALMLAVIRFFF